MVFWTNNTLLISKIPDSSSIHINSKLIIIIVWFFPPKCKLWMHSQAEVKTHFAMIVLNVIFSMRGNINYPCPHLIILLTSISFENVSVAFNFYKDLQRGQSFNILSKFYITSETFFHNQLLASHHYNTISSEIFNLTFVIGNYPHLDGDVPHSISYRIYFS
jgi:hypothetical protein